MTLNHLFSTLKGGPGSGNWGHAGRLGKHGGSAPKGISSVLSNIIKTDNYKKVKEKADKQIKELAQIYGITEEQYKTKLEDAMRKGLTSKKIKIRMSEKALNQVLKDEEIKNTFDTQKSSAEYKANGLTYAKYLEARDEGEKDLFGHSSRPIYGFFEKKQGAVESVKGYGNVSIILKEDVKNRSTFTDADSLDYGAGRFVPSKVSDPKVYSSLFLTNWSDPLTASWNNLSKKDEKYGYIEAQIFGGVKLKDIDRVHFDKNPSQKTIAALEQKGLKWTTSN